MGLDKSRGKAPKILELECRVVRAIWLNDSQVGISDAISHSRALSKGKDSNEKTPGQGGLSWQRPVVDADNKLPVFLRLWSLVSVEIVFLDLGMGNEVFACLSTNPPGIEHIVNEPTSNWTKILSVIRQWIDCSLVDFVFLFLLTHGYCLLKNERWLLNLIL